MGVCVFGGIVWLNVLWIYIVLEISKCGFGIRRV